MFNDQEDKVIYLVDHEKYRDASEGKYDEIIEAYREMLIESSSEQLELTDEEDKKTMDEICDYLKCILAKVSYLQNKNLEEAIKELNLAKCYLNDFSETDREFYVGKIESRILCRKIVRYYMSKEEGMKLLSE